MKKRLYIAYGSNLNARQMRWRCPRAKPVGKAKLEGYRLLFKGSGTGSYLTIEPQAGASVPAAVWEVTERDELALDHYEGFPGFYYKKELELPVRDFQTGEVHMRTAFVYIMHEERPYGIPSRAYMEACEEGYRDFGFDAAILREAYRFSEEKARELQ